MLGQFVIGQKLSDTLGNNSHSQTGSRYKLLPVLFFSLIRSLFTDYNLFQNKINTEFLAGSPKENLLWFQQSLNPTEFKIRIL